MPLVRADADPVTRIVTATGFRIWHFVVEFSWAFMIAATGLIVLRTILVAVLAALHHRRTRRRPGPAAYAPPLSVIIAAYNEEKVIAATLRSVTDTSYAGRVRGDGDRRRIEGPDGPRSGAGRLHGPAHPPHPPGKRRQIRGAAAGVAEAKHDILVFLDADTHFARETFAELVQPLHDPAWAPSPAMRRWATCAPSSPAARRWNTSAGSISTAAPTRNGTASRWRPERSARCASRRWRKRAASRWIPWPRIPTSRSACTSRATAWITRPRALAWTEAPESVRHAGEAALPLGLRHAAMPVEASRPGLQSAVRRARLVFAAERLVFPDRARGAHAHRGCAAHSLAAPRRLGGDVVLLPDFSLHGSRASPSWPAGWTARNCARPG